MKRVLPIVLFVTALVGGVSFLAVQAFTDVELTHDEAISFLAATGHQAAYNNDAPSCQWVPTTQWQAFWTPAKFGCFAAISRDLAKTDIHPPLYFWLLHVCSHIYGVYLSTGPVLNILFHVIAAIAIFWSCHLLRCSPWVSGAAGAVWMLNAEILSVALEAHQYSLLGAIAACFIASLIISSRSSSILSFIPLMLFTLMGMLTHYHFVVFLMILGGTAGAQLYLKKDWRHSRTEAIE